ncbi:hypothetical protein RFI_31347 [Reticulomyxa filosa]|uniref:Uncharacterized protein n=1 Tax=Reticulomyxa filosa TaxID=46433 RepID=X6LZ85_RETFI|nr:hypothetical protein RFI_31347 [Reticulomyxa filosa]|eukprot:ETO06050.1 hypothetical protein RFI_31347 [Reticulomyxa filosa]
MPKKKTYCQYLIDFKIYLINTKSIQNKNRKVQGISLQFVKEFFKEGLEVLILMKNPQWNNFKTTLAQLKKILFQKSGTCAKEILMKQLTNPQQGLHLVRLLEEYGNKMDKITILETWKQCNQIYFDTLIKLMNISYAHNTNKLKILKITKNESVFVIVCILNRMEENNELKIMREMCLHILWNIISYPKTIKYRQINTNSLYQILKRKCYQFNVNVDSLFEKMQSFLKGCGFQKENNDWYYYFIKYNDQWSLLWGRYITWIEQQPIYKTRIDIPKITCMLSNGKWKEYVILFDYEYRRIVLLDANKVVKSKKIKLKTLHVGNPKKSSFEFNVHIEWYNDCPKTEINSIKYCNLILNYSWHFRTMNDSDRDYLSNYCSVNDFTPKKLIK